MAMMFLVMFEDDEAFADQRAIHMEAHQEFLATNARMVLAAGPVADAETGVAAGGAWLVAAGSVAAVRRLVETDPFWLTGLRKDVRVLRWRRVFADGARLRP